MVKATLKTLTLVGIVGAMLVGGKTQAMLPMLARTAARGIRIIAPTLERTTSTGVRTLLKTSSRITPACKGTLSVVKIPARSAIAERTLSPVGTLTHVQRTMPMALAHRALHTNTHADTTTNAATGAKARQSEFTAILTTSTFKYATANLEFLLMQPDNLPFLLYMANQDKKFAEKLSSFICANHTKYASLSGIKDRAAFCTQLSLIEKNKEALFMQAAANLDKLLMYKYKEDTAALLPLLLYMASQDTAFEESLACATITHLSNILEPKLWIENCKRENECFVLTFALMNKKVAHAVYTWAHTHLPSLTRGGAGGYQFLFDLADICTPFKEKLFAYTKENLLDLMADPYYSGVFFVKDLLQKNKQMYELFVAYLKNNISAMLKTENGRDALKLMALYGDTYDIFKQAITCCTMTNLPVMTATAEGQDFLCWLAQSSDYHKTIVINYATTNVETLVETENGQAFITKIKNTLGINVNPVTTKIMRVIRKIAWGSSSQESGK